MNKISDKYLKQIHEFTQNGIQHHKSLRKWEWTYCYTHFVLVAHLKTNLYYMLERIWSNWNCPPLLGGNVKQHNFLGQLMPRCYELRFYISWHDQKFCPLQVSLACTSGLEWTLVVKTCGLCQRLQLCWQCGTRAT